MTLVDQSGTDTSLSIILTAARRLLDTVSAARPFLRDWPTAHALRPTVAAGCPVLAWLNAAAAISPPATANLAAAIAAAAGVLTWRQSYTAAAFGEAFLQRYGWTEFVGLKGPVPSTALACGVLLLGPEVAYPAHAHEAEELYLPLSGTALWTRGEEDAVPRSPGEPIHHASWVPHAMRTEAEPLLALYLWRGGDLGAKPAIMR